MAGSRHGSELRYPSGLASVILLLNQALSKIAQCDREELAKLPRLNPASEGSTSMSCMVRVSRAAVGTRYSAHEAFDQPWGENRSYKAEPHLQVVARQSLTGRPMCAALSLRWHQVIGRPLLGLGEGCRQLAGRRMKAGDSSSPFAACIWDGGDRTIGRGGRCDETSAAHMSLMNMKA